MAVGTAALVWLTEMDCDEMWIRCLVPLGVNLEFADGPTFGLMVFLHSEQDESQSCSTIWINLVITVKHWPSGILNVFTWMWHRCRRKQGAQWTDEWLWCLSASTNYHIIWICVCVGFISSAPLGPQLEQTQRGVFVSWGGRGGFFLWSGHFVNN